MKPNTQQFKQRRRFVMVLPLLVTPFLTLIFWALGGGQGTATYGMKTKNAGLNLELPNAQFQKDDNAWDKLSLYQQAQRDSIKYNEAKRNDPYFKLPPLKESQDTTKKPGGVNTSLGKKDHSIDENEERVNKKLAELYKNLNATPTEQKPRYENELTSKQENVLSNDVEKLEAMMEMMQSNGAEDEEMKEIQSVLDKILDIQHPQRVKERLKTNGGADSIFTYRVSPAREQSVGIFGSAARLDSSHYSPIQNRFFGLNELSTVEKAPTAIEAEVYDAQTLVTGSVIKLKLTKDIYVNGVLVPKNHFIHGTCVLSGERLKVEITSIRSGSAIYPVALSVFDLDGLEGIHVPGAIARDVAKQSSNQALQDVQLGTLDPSIEVQAASAGIETVKNLVSKRTKLIKVSVKAGYKVLLIDSQVR
jgi:conjugative transposon TraM protein